MGWSLSMVEEFWFRGESAHVHPDGNNASWTCPCGHAVLFVYQRGRIGSHPDSPSLCRACGTGYYLMPTYPHGAEPPAGDTQAPAERMEIMEAHR